MDILNTEEFYEKNLTFYPTEPVNEAFAFFGIENKNFVLNSGSYLVF